MVLKAVGGNGSKTTFQKTAEELPQQDLRALICLREDEKSKERWGRGASVFVVFGWIPTKPWEIPTKP